MGLSYRSKDPADWPLEGEPHGVVSFVESAITPENRFAQCLTFTCSKEQYDAFSAFDYLGLNGVGFVIQERQEEEGRYFFTVDAWCETLEKTIFSSEKIVVGEDCTLSFLFAIQRRA